ncbi:MAG: hypothetical protein QXP44_04220 [Candidatus Bathyarchaeia archaeon]
MHLWLQPATCGGKQRRKKRLIIAEAFRLCPLHCSAAAYLPPISQSMQKTIEGVYLRHQREPANQSTVSIIFTADAIHRKYAFKAARNATVSFASTLRIKKLPSRCKTAFARRVAGLLASGAKASKTVAKYFSESKRKRTVAFAFTASAFSIRLLW